MSEPVQPKLNYGSDSVVSSGTVPDSPVPADDYDTAITPVAEGAAESRQAAYDDVHRDHKWHASGESPSCDQEPTDWDKFRARNDADVPAAAELVTSPRRLSAASSYTTGIWIGLVLAVAGFGAIFFTWTNVASLANVAQQMPYLVSGGLSGIVLIIAGATVIDVVMRMRDSRDRTKQLAQMTNALIEVRELLECEPRQRKAE